MNNILLVLLLPVVLCRYSKRLRFNSHTNKFKFLVFNDLHYGEGDERDSKSEEFQKKILDAEKPDLVILNGDASSNYSAECNKYNCTEWFVTNWKRFTKPMIERQIPYAYNLGNHDSLLPNHPLSREIMEIDITSSWSVSRNGPSDIHGASNYFVHIYSPTGNFTITSLVLLDSGINDCLGVKGWGCVYPDQAGWLRRNLKRFKRGFVFSHIPPVEVKSLYNTNSVIFGNKSDNIGCYSVNTGLFATLLESSFKTETLISGHDHNNDFWGIHDGILIGYGRKSGHGGYAGGSRYFYLLNVLIVPQSDDPGARVIQLELENDDFSWNTWTRVESSGLVKDEELIGERKPQVICEGMDGFEVEPLPKNFDNTYFV